MIRNIILQVGCACKMETKKKRWLSETDNRKLVEKSECMRNMMELCKKKKGPIALPETYPILDL
jgi:hypothetical protein